MENNQNLQKETDALIGKFRSELNIEGYSELTIKTYCDYLFAFKKFVKKDLAQVNNDDIIAYLANIKTKKRVSSATLNLILSAIKHFYSKFLKQNIAIDIKLPKKAKKIPVVLTSSEISNLIAATKGIRNKLILEFLFSTGVRVSECTNMKISDLDFEECTGKVIGGKGNKDRVIILSKKWVSEYKTYFERQNKKKNSEFVFCNSLGKKLSVDTIQKFIKNAKQIAKMDKKISPHTLRHSFATNLLENDVNIRYIQQLLGHANLNTTQIYTKVNTNKLKTIKNPLDQL